MIDRILDASEIRRQLELEPLTTVDLSEVRARLQVEVARVKVEEFEANLRSEVESESPSPWIIFPRTLDVADALQGLLERQFELSELLEVNPDSLERIREAQQHSGSRGRVNWRCNWSRSSSEEQMQQLPDFRTCCKRRKPSVDQMQELVREADQLLGLSQEGLDAAAKLQNTISQVQTLMSQSVEILDQIGTTLQPIDLDVDDAMITALLLRFDLMNQRGALADDWRQIKLAADDLRSILNLNATQRIGTDPTTTDPFNFTFDESQTSLRLTFDAPLNRLAQRNAYRFSQLNYQAAIRDLGGLEDSIKFDVRNDLRNLALDREQYRIAVASAALAFERVVSTSLEFRLGTGGVSARDFLEAQTAYTDALSAVASRQISYILDRTQLFLDLELLTVNDQGFWEELYMQEYEPTPYFEFPSWALPVYGTLPCVKYSKCIRCPMEVPPGMPMIHRPVDGENGEELPIASPNEYENYFDPSLRTDEILPIEPQTPDPQVPAQVPE